MLRHGLQDELVVRLELCCGIWQCASILPDGLQDGLTVRREPCHCILQCGPSMQRGSQDELAVRLELRQGTLALAGGRPEIAVVGW